jgi:hypothetical protein
MDKHLSDTFPIQGGLRQKTCFTAIPFQLCFRIRHLEDSRKAGRTEIESDTRIPLCSMLQMATTQTREGKTQTPYYLPFLAANAEKTKNKFI